MIGMSVNPQLENGHIRIANEIWDEIIRRDFSKRQKDILQFILRLSYGCNHKVAHVPLLRDFSLCGVTQNHITEELLYLKNCKVIDWSREDMFFSFNKNYEIWQVSPVKKWDDERFRELIHINLTSQNRNFPKQELPKKGNDDFPKRETGHELNPWESKAEDASKDSIKDLTTTTTETVMDIHLKVFKTFSISGLIQDYFGKLRTKGFTDAFIKELMLETGEAGTNPSLRLMETIGDRWERDGIYTRAESKRRKQESKQELQIARSDKPKQRTTSQMKPEKKERVVPLYVRQASGDDSNQSHDEWNDGRGNR